MAGSSAHGDGSFGSMKSTGFLDEPSDSLTFKKDSVFNLVMFLMFVKICALIGFCSVISITILSMPNAGKDDHDNVAFECLEGFSVVSYNIVTCHLRAR